MKIIYLSVCRVLNIILNAPLESPCEDTHDYRSYLHLLVSILLKKKKIVFELESKCQLNTYSNPLYNETDIYLPG